MIDITPRDSINYNQPTMMAGDTNFRGSAASPTHSAFAREFNEPDGECTSTKFVYYMSYIENSNPSFLMYFLKTFSSLHVLHHSAILCI